MFARKLISREACGPTRSENAACSFLRDFSSLEVMSLSNNNLCITCRFPRIFGYVLQVLKYSIPVPLDRGGFGGWNLMLTLCSVAVVSSVVVMSSHLITNRMRFYFFQSKCVVNVSSACHFPTRGGMQCKIVRLSLSFPEISYRKILVKFSTYPDPLE